MLHAQYTLRIHVHSACPCLCCISMSMLHIHVHAICPFHAACPCRSVCSISLQPVGAFPSKPPQILGNSRSISLVCSGSVHVNIKEAITKFKNHQRFFLNWIVSTLTIFSPTQTSATAPLNKAMLKTFFLQVYFLIEFCLVRR
jgi:hypothetical protein